MTQKPAENMGGQPVLLDLSAVIVAMQDGIPAILSVEKGGLAVEARAALPAGPFDPVGHRTLEAGLKASVEAQTGLKLGYVEQLYTFGNKGRLPPTPSGDSDAGGPRAVSVGYLALVRASDQSLPDGTVWSGWYRHLPWEDWRDGRPDVIPEVILPAIEKWAADGPEEDHARRMERGDLTFGLQGAEWDSERVLERYELAYEAGLVPESHFDGRSPVSAQLPLGSPMAHDHRRILATAMGRLRGKIKYRPVVFDLMPQTFTLFDLQKTVEALAGGRLHKQNFRRLVSSAGLVEPTGRMSTQTGGRPAELFRFRKDVLTERLSPGVRVPQRLRQP